MEQFKKDVAEGLGSRPKRLSSKYIYDKRGSDLFMKIMRMPEYYLTAAELDIFSNKTKELVNHLELNLDEAFELIELGAGDGYKTIELLTYLHDNDFRFRYLPIDISKAALNQLEENVEAVLPDVAIEKKQGDYFTMLRRIAASPKPKVLLFLGSNIGNLTDERATAFLKDLSGLLRPGDKMLLGVDLIKPKAIILPAYNDAQGITEAFNLNLLARINRELDGDFDLDAFEHAPEYDEVEGIARSYIRSKKEQQVHIKAIGGTYHFEVGEKIHTEISRKYSESILQSILEPTAFELIAKVKDSKGYFADFILKRTNHERS